MEVGSRIENESVYITFHSEYVDYEQFQAFKEIIEQNTERTEYIIDLSRVNSVGSIMLGMLWMLRTHTKAGENIKVINCNQEVFEIFQSAKYNTLFHISNGYS